MLFNQLRSVSICSFWIDDGKDKEKFVSKNHFSGNFSC